DLVCNFSSRGPSAGDFVLKPDCVAPGNKIVSLNAPGSTLCRQVPGNQVYPATALGSASAASYTAPYFTLSGTSMATPVVGGIAALMLQKTPSLTPTIIKGRLMKTAQKMSGANIYMRGAGYVQAVPALLSSELPATSVSPFVVRGSSGV